MNKKLLDRLFFIQESIEEASYERRLTPIEASTWEVIRGIYKEVKDGYSTIKS